MGPIPGRVQRLEDQEAQSKEHPHTPVLLVLPAGLPELDTRYERFGSWCHLHEDIEFWGGEGQGPQIWFLVMETFPVFQCLGYRERTEGHDVRCEYVFIYCPGSLDTGMQSRPLRTPYYVPIMTVPAPHGLNLAGG
jgi:hypothetical protein